MVEVTDGCCKKGQGLFHPVSLGYPLSVFNTNSTLKERKMYECRDCVVQGCEPTRQLVECKPQLARRVVLGGSVLLVGLQNELRSQVDTLQGFYFERRRSMDFRGLYPKKKGGCKFSRRQPITKCRGRHKVQ